MPSAITRVDSPTDHMAQGRGRAALGALALLVLCLFGGLLALPVAGQQRDEPLRVQPPEIAVIRSSPPAHSLNPLSDRDAERWLKRAGDAAERGDWKLAADTLLRVIDEYGDRVVSVEGGTQFYSAARCARQQIVGWPPEGIEAYRLLYDAEAAQELRLARQDHDLDALRRIARRFSFSTAAPEAMDLLASWLIDLRRGDEAVDLLLDLAELPQQAIARWRILSKLAIARALAGQRQQALDALDDMRAMQDADLPAQWAQRIESIQRFIDIAEQASQQFSSPGAAQAWAFQLGPPSAGGRTPPIEPAVTPEDFWRDLLPGAERVDVRTVDRLIKSTGRFPVWQCVSDGTRLFVTCPEGLIARDLGTFDFLWRIVPKAPPRDPQIDMFRQSVGTNESNNRGRLDELSTRTLWHEYRGAVSTAFGLVFLIEQAGTSKEQFPTLEGLSPPNDIFTYGHVLEPNSLRAFEADTGRAVWTKGRGGPIEDDLRFVHFYSTPVPAGDVLIAPYQAGEDLYLAVMQPDGKVVRKLLLGHGRAGLFPMNGVLQPTVHDGTIYVPTGAGLLVALNAHDFSLRWLTGYERTDVDAISSRQRGAVWQSGAYCPAQPNEWMSTAPVISAGLVILAAQDSNQLAAYERGTGRQVWTHPRGGFCFVVGADGRRVFIAGEQVAALDIQTGQRVWTYEDHAPSGRPILSGDRVLMPTAGGLVRLDAATGSLVDEPLRTRYPLGNLLALDGSLYSVSADSLSKFPDVRQSRESAEQSLAENPADIGAILRLAWLDTHEGKWPQALEALDRAESLASGGREQDLRDRISHQRVTVLLSLAEESTPDERADLLERAAASARQPGDLIKARLALCEHRGRVGDRVAAFELAFELLLEQGGEPVSLEGSLHARAEVLIGERLQPIWSEASDHEREQIAAHVERLANQPDSPLDSEQLVRLADAISLVDAPRGAAATATDAPESPASRCAARIYLRLGKQDSAEADLEGAACFLEKAAARSPQTEVGLEAMLRLATLHCKPAPGIPRAPCDAKRVLELLEHNHAGQPLPPACDDLATLWDARTVKAFVQSAWATLPPSLRKSPLPMPTILRGTQNLELVHSEWIPASMGLRNTAGFLDPSRPVDIFAEVMPLRFLRLVIGLNTTGSGRGDPRSDDGSWWNIELENAIDDAAARQGRVTDLTNPPFAAVAGRVAVLASGTQMCAVGLDSGRALWPVMRIETEFRVMPEPPLIQIDGTVFLALDAGTITAVPARPGAAPIWRRRFGGRRLGSLSTAGGRLVAIDEPVETLMVLDPVSGRIERQFDLLLPTRDEPDDLKVRSAVKNIIDQATGTLKSPESGELPEAVAGEGHAAVTSQTVCRGAGRRVVGRDILTGRTLWDLPMAGLVEDVIKLDENHFGICYRTEKMAVIHARTGELVADLDLRGLQSPPSDATLDWPSETEGRVTVFSQTSEDPPRYALTSFSLEGGKQVWRHDLGELALVSPRMLRASPRYVAAIMYALEPPEEIQLRGGANLRNRPQLESAKLVVLDKTTHRRLIDQPYTFDISRSPDDPGRTGLFSDVIILDSRIVAVGPDGYHVLAAGTSISGVGP